MRNENYYTPEEEAMAFRAKSEAVDYFFSRRHSALLPYPESDSADTRHPIPSSQGCLQSVYAFHSRQCHCQGLPDDAEGCEKNNQGLRTQQTVLIMNYDVIENSKADLRLSRRKALELLPVLRKRDEGGRIVRIDPRTIKIVRNR